MEWTERSVLRICFDFTTDNSRKWDIFPSGEHGPIQSLRTMCFYYCCFHVFVFFALYCLQNTSSLNIIHLKYCLCYFCPEIYNKASLTPPLFYWSSKARKWAVYLCVNGIDFTSFYDCSIGCLNFELYILFFILSKYFSNLSCFVVDDRMTLWRLKWREHRRESESFLTICLITVALVEQEHLILLKHPSLCYLS